MPVYNSQEYVNNAINSVLKQTYGNFELIIVDDGSSDKSFEVCKEAENKDSRIRLFRKDNGGVCSARNYGMKLAKGNYITFIDNDDDYDENFLQSFVAQLSENETDIVKCGRKNVTVDSNGKELKSKSFAWKENKVFNKEELLENYLPLKATGILSSVWNGLYRKEFLEKNNITFNEDFRHGNEDVFFNIMCFQKGASVGIISDVLYNHYYRINHSTSMSFKEKQILDMAETFNEEYKYLEGIDNYSFEGAYLKNTRIFFKQISLADDSKERKKGVEKSREYIDFKKLSKMKILSRKDLNIVEKLELSLIKKKLFGLFFFEHRLLKKMG